MKSIFKPLLITSVLATSALWAQAQTPPPAAAPTQTHARAMKHDGRMDPAMMHERMAARQAKLKAKLNLNASQEGAWNDYMGAMQPPANGMMGKSREERRKMFDDLKAMTTPQRLDRMNAMQADRTAKLQQRSQATRNFYDTLTAEQQKTFDASTMMGAAGGWQGHKGGHGHG